MSKAVAMWRKDGTLQQIGMPSWLSNASLQTLMLAFEDAGFQIYAVGGCVRDTVLGRAVKDVDLSTDAPPDRTTQIIESLATKDHPWKAIPTGVEHRTITAVARVGSGPYEITTFRTDVETDGRHATVAFSHKIEDDAARRDFTINAFYADRHGKVQDLVGGSVDIAMQRVRFIGDPAARIKEDYLRILRFFRFTASHGNQDDGIDADGLAACAMHADGLRAISRERIGTEVSRIIMGANAAPITGSMEQSGVLNRILPGASVLTLARLIDLERQSESELATRLAALGCEDIADRLRLPNVEAKKIGIVRSEAGKSTAPHELGFHYGFDQAVQCLLLRWASLLEPFDQMSLIDVELGAASEFPVQAADLMPELSGKNLGDRLKHLEAAWLRSKFTMTKSELLALS